MSDNPYAGPKTVDTRVTVPDCPRFPRESVVCGGEVGQADALQMADESRPFPVPAATKSPWRSINAALAVLAVAVGLVWLTDSNDFLNPPMSSTQAVLLWLTIALAAAVLASWTIFIYRNYPRARTADPPVGGQREFEFTPDWFSVRQKTRDGRNSLLRFPWSQTTVTACDQGWLLQYHSAYYTVLPKNWVESAAIADTLDRFFLDLAVWRASGEQTATAASPERSRGGLPPLPPGIEFQPDGVAARRHVYRMRRELRVRFPRYSFALLWWERWLAMVGCLLFVCAAANLAIWLITVRGSAMVIWGVSGPSIMLSCMSLVLTFRFRTRTQNVRGVITDEAIWLNDRGYQTKILTSDYPVRESLLDTVVLANIDGTQLLVISKSFFENDVSWRQACAALEATG